MQIEIDITEVAGPKLADLRNIGQVPEQLGGRDLHVSNPSGSRIVVRDYSNDQVIVSGNGWSNAMQALADNYDVPVVVACDPGVTGGKSGKVVGTWTPGTRKQAKATDPADVMQAECQEIPARDLQPGMLAELVPGEWVEVLQVKQGQRVSVTFNDEPRRRFQRHHDDLVRIADPATVRFTPAQENLLRLVAAGRIQYFPGNGQWAPGYARRGPMFKAISPSRGFRYTNRTQSAEVLDRLGMLRYDEREAGTVTPSGPALAWLAAHPA